MNSFINIFTKFFKGEESLKRSFWIYYFIGMYTTLVMQLIVNKFFPLKYIFEIYLVFASIGLWRCVSKAIAERNLKTNQKFNKNIDLNFLHGFLMILIKSIIIVNFSVYVVKIHYWWNLMISKL